MNITGAHDYKEPPRTAKMFNHKFVYNKIHSCLYTDAVTRGMSQAILCEIIETLEDCACEICTPFLDRFKTVLELRQHGFHDAASNALTLGLINIGQLLVPQNYGNN